MAEKENVKLSEDVPAAAAAVSGERRAGLGLHVYGQVLVLYVGPPKTWQHFREIFQGLVGAWCQRSLVLRARPGAPSAARHAC